MKTKHLKLYVLFFFIIQSVIVHLSAQETMIVGQVMNSADRSPIPYANIYFKNTTIGTQSNEEGYFLIKTAGTETTLIISALGFSKRSIHIKRGENVGVDVLLEEENTLLGEIFIIPGTNPALDLMKKVRLMRKVNDLSQHVDYKAQSTEQNLILLDKYNQRSTGRKIYNQLKTGNLIDTDSTLSIPLYMAQSNYQLSAGKKVELSKNIFSSPESGVNLLEKLLGNLETELNFYDNAVSIMGTKIISPLANVGFAYYKYYLADSLKTEFGKQYIIHFKTKNTKNLAFYGKMYIDSASFALTYLEAELPNNANINYINNLHIKEEFSLKANSWLLNTEVMSLTMNYGLLADSTHSNPQLFVKRTANYRQTDSLSTVKNFASSDYSTETLDEKLKDLNNTPILRTAKWIADVIFTGYMNFGKIDIGKVQQLMRITEIEGLRLTLPFRTNEHLWKNVSVGGYVGYGFNNKMLKYSGFGQVKIPGNKKRILELNYSNDYKRVDYNYNNYLYRENPLVSGDIDISNTVFALEEAEMISDRHDYSISLSNDWTSNIESKLYLRSNTMLANGSMPMLKGTLPFNSLLQQSATLATRFSFNERTYEDHLQRIYISNSKPVIYSILEYGNYTLGQNKGEYAKLEAIMRQQIKFNYGQVKYIANAGWIAGNVPYQLLYIPPGCETGGYSAFHFNLMNYMEYASDKYINLHTELMTNGLILNQIPLIKKLNLREMCSFNIAYGSLSDKHKQVLDFPTNMNPMEKPYVEFGVGITNILGIFTLQSMWRLTDRNHPGIDPWGLRGSISLQF